MKKILKTLTIVMLAAMATMACVFAFGCQDKGETTADYTILIVYADDTPVNGHTAGTNQLYNGKLSVGICIPGGVCLDLNTKNVFPDATGKLSFSQATLDSWLKEFNNNQTVEAFEFHVYDAKDCVGNQIITVSEKGTHTIKLAAAA